MAEYESSHSGGQIDDSVDAYLNYDTTVQAGSLNLITSGAVAEALAEILAEIDTVNGDLQGAKSSITKNAEDIAGIDRRLVSVTNVVSSFEPRLRSAEYNITTLQNKYEEAEESLKQINTRFNERFNTVEDDISYIKASDLGQNSRLNVIANAITQLTQNITSQGNRIGAVESNIIELSNKESENEAYINNINTRLGNLGQNAASMASADAARDNQLNAHTQKITQLIQDIGRIESDVQKNATSPLITYDQYRAENKLFKLYFVARDEADILKNKCWRIYYRYQLIGEFNVEGSVTLPKFPIRFPFRFA